MDYSQLTYPQQLRGHSERLLGGETPAALGLDGWTITDSSMVLGQGRECFDQATQRLFTWQAHRFAGYELRTWAQTRWNSPSGPPGPGA